jgi:hypothetical protein
VLVKKNDVHGHATIETRVMLSKPGIIHKKELAKFDYRPNVKEKRIQEPFYIFDYHKKIKIWKTRDFFKKNSTKILCMCWNQIFQVNFSKKDLMRHNKFRDCKIIFLGLPKKKKSLDPNKQKSVFFCFID